MTYLHVYDQRGLFTFVLPILLIINHITNINRIEFRTKYKKQRL